MFYNAFPVGTQMTVVNSDDDTPFSGFVAADSHGDHYLACDDGVSTVYCSPAEVVYCSVQSDVTVDNYLPEEKKEKNEMKKKIVGKQKVDYVSKKTNQPVIGITLHCESETNDDRFEGTQVETIFISNKSPMYNQCVSFPIGSVVTVMYNRWGSPESVLLDK